MEMETIGGQSSAAYMVEVYLRPIHDENHPYSSRLILAAMNSHSWIPAGVYSMIQ